MQKIEYLKIELLKTHPSNPRFIKDNQFKILCESLKKNPDYFETRPILCNKNYIVFAGNMRLRAAQQIGLELVPCCIMDISEERQKELMIRDNKTNGEFDWDILANHYEIPDLKEWGFEDFEIGNLDFSPVGIEEQGKLDEKKKVICPKCGEQFEPK